MRRKSVISNILRLPVIIIAGFIIILVCAVVFQKRKERR